MNSWPDAAPLGIESGAGSPVLESLIRGPGAALPALVLVGGTGEAAAWSAAAAVAVARAWVATGRRVVLVDLGVERPALHERLGLANDEGTADHFAFGTSLRLLARSVEDGAWSFVPAGLWLEQPAALLGSGEWPALIGEAGAQDGTLLLYAPADAPGLPELAQHVGAVVALAPVRVPGIRGYSVLAAFGPEPEPVAPAAVVEPVVAEGEPRAGERPRSTEEEFERVRLPKEGRAREALIADLRMRQRTALMQPPADAVARAGGERPPVPVRPGELAGALSPEAAGTLSEPASLASFPVLEVPAPAARGRRPLLYALGVAALLLVAAGAWQFVQYLGARRAQLYPPEEELAPAPAQPATPTDAAAPDTVLSFAVAMEAHQLLPDARERVAALRSSLPQTGFFIAPLVREDVLYYHVMAGPVRDSAQAGALMDTLIARRHKTGGTAADIRHAPLAFLVGEYASPDSASARVTELDGLEIPAYVIALNGPPPRWRVYAGGYAGPAEADVMRQLLESAGVPDTLVPRTGRTGR